MSNDLNCDSYISEATSHGNPKEKKQEKPISTYQKRCYVNPENEGRKVGVAEGGRYKI